FHAEVGGPAGGQAHRGRRAGDFLHRDDVGEVAQSGAAQLLFDRDPEKTELAQLRPQVARKFVRAIDLRGARRDLGRGEVVDRLPQNVDGFAQSEIECRQLAHRLDVDVYVNQ